MSIVLLCLGLLTVLFTACGSRSGDDGKGSAGDGSAVGSADATAGNGDSAGSAGTGSVDPIAECSALGAALCHQLYACLPATDLAANPQDFGASEAECATFRACDPTLAACIGTYSPAQAATCVNIVTTLSCDDFLTFFNARALPDACNTVCQ